MRGHETICMNFKLLSFCPSPGRLSSGAALGGGVSPSRAARPEGVSAVAGRMGSRIASATATPVRGVFLLGGQSRGEGEGAKAGGVAAGGFPWIWRPACRLSAGLHPRSAHGNGTLFAAGVWFRPPRPAERPPQMRRQRRPIAGGCGVRRPSHAHAAAGAHGVGPEALALPTLHPRRSDGSAASGGRERGRMVGHRDGLLLRGRLAKNGKRRLAGPAFGAQRAGRDHRAGDRRRNTCPRCATRPGHHSQKYVPWTARPRRAKGPVRTTRRVPHAR